MTELDQLAAAAHAPARLPAAPRRRRLSAGAWIAIGLGVGFLLGGLFLLLRIDGIGGRGEPGFRVSEGRGWIRISNGINDPLEVRAVRVNGEYDALPGRHIGDGYAQQQRKRPYPIEIRIGMDDYFVYGGPFSGSDYAADGVYFDIRTNRGNWHYEGGRLR